jgi:acetyl-CoA carboxylase biotin carboxyl carrier protein
MDLEEIQKLISFLDGTDVAEIEINREGQSVRITRQSVQPVAMPMMVPQQVTAHSGMPVQQLTNAQSFLSPSAVEAPPPRKGTAIPSPMVGTFYRTPSPDSPPFVEEGDMVKKGQVVCIIEAMKLMNEIEAEISGKVLQILKENASPVEYGEELFLIEPV